MSTKPFSMKVEKLDLEEYRKYADDLGFPLGLFIKLVLKLHAKEVYLKIKGDQGRK